MKSIFERIILTIFLIATSFVLLAAQNDDLTAADSLFAQKKYTEAFKQYEQIFDKGLASPAMLMKMAFIKEGLGSYTEALYYLNLYYQQTSDKSAARKMRELAETHDLYGYEYSDLKFIVGFVRKYASEIIAGLLVFSAFLLAYGYRKHRKGEKPVISVALQVVTLTLVLIISNELFKRDTAIISRENSLLMTGPSAGAEPIDYIQKGNKVFVLEQDALWSKIKWGNDVAYIRTKNLMRL